MKTILPMLAQIGDLKILDEPGYIYEPKLDGIRVLCTINKEGTHLTNRRGVGVSYKYPELHDIKKFINARSCILDGEIIVYNAKGLPDIYSALQRSQASIPKLITYYHETIPVTYVVFDIIMHNDKFLFDKPLMERKIILDTVIKKSEPTFEKIFYTADGNKLWKEVLHYNLEGIMAKTIDGLYYPGLRKDVWLKLKLKYNLDAIIVGYTTKNRSVSSLALAVYNDNKELQYIGKVGTGFNEAIIQELHARLKKIIVAKPHLKLPADYDKTLIWVKPKIICEVSYLEITRQQRLRVPVFIRLRDDKKPKECTFKN